MMTRGIHVGRLFGVEVVLDWSLLIIFALVTMSLGAGALPMWHPDWGAGVVWLTAVASAALFLVSVLLHELSHALTGRAFGISVPRITLFVFGGVAQMEDEPTGWKAEFWMALAGPLTSVALGAIFLGLGFVVAGPLPPVDVAPEMFVRSLSPLATILFWLGPLNFVLALFNMVPGFPLDGGRVLRALIWGATGDLTRATRMASNGGRVFAAILIATGFAMALGIQVPFFGSGLLGGLWLALIGWFLNNAAVMSYRQLLIRESLGDVTVERVMNIDVRSLPPGLPVKTFVDDHLLRSDQRAYPVVEAGRLLGLVSMRDVYKIPRADWEGHTIAEIMTPTEALVSIRPSASAYDAIHALNARALNQLPVVEDGIVKGMIRREDILRWLSIYGDGRLRAPIEA